MEATTTLVCLFHHEQQAQAALADLHKAGVPEASTSIIGGDGASVDALDKSELASIGMPDRDYDRLKDGIRDGGVVIAVNAAADHVQTVESIFGSHKAEKIDDVASAQKEPLVASEVAAVPLAASNLATDAQAVPVIQEDLVVGKRTVDDGGVRLYRRVVEVPVQEDVVLREEHVNVNRVPVDRAVTDADGAFQSRTIELTETAEEAVVTKNARVVEEIVLNKDVVEHTQTVQDTVRHTEVEVEELLPQSTSSTTTAKRSTL